MRVDSIKGILPFAIPVLALVVFWSYWDSTRTPGGQPVLTSLTPSNFDQFKREFNDAADRTRLVLLLSPT
jgi:hypothetical protein